MHWSILQGHLFIGVLDFGPSKKNFRLCFVPPVLICRMHLSKYGESLRFFCILLLRLDVLHYNDKIELFVLRFQLLALSAPPPWILGPSKLWDLWPWHNIRIFPQFSKVVSDYFHPIIQLVFFLIAYYCFHHTKVVSRGMVSPAIVLDSPIRKHVALRVHI